MNDVNLKSMFLTCKHVLPHMERQGKGAIVNIASVSGISLVRGSLHLLRGNQGGDYPVHPCHCPSIRSLWHPGDTVLPGMMNTPMVHRSGGHCGLWRQCRGDGPPP